MTYSIISFGNTTRCGILVVTSAVLPFVLWMSLFDGVLYFFPSPFLGGHLNNFIIKVQKRRLDF